MIRLNRRNKKGFTLIELLVVVLILAILMAVALPLYVSSVADASKKTCRSNMQSIANAAQAWKVKNRKADFTDMNYATGDLNPDLGSKPKTPAGVDYIVVKTGTVPGPDPAVTTDDVTLVAGDIGITSGANGDGECGGFVPGKMNQ